MDNKVHDIWSVLEKGKITGLVKRLYSGDCCLNIYCTFHYPENYYGIALSIPKSITIKYDFYQNLSEISVDLYEDSSFPECCLLCVQLRNPVYKDVFSYLCENVIKKLSFSNNEKEVVKEFCNSLVKWKSLFDKSRQQHLTSMEQQGLFGELHFLQKCLSMGNDYFQDVLNFYVGTDKALRDFQGPKWAVEVKTTSSNNPQEIIIHGERQLDDSMVENLFLFHCSVEVSKYSGETLIDKINAIRLCLSVDNSVLSLFNAKLFEAGYLDEHAEFYKERCYGIRKESFYHVKGNFPRICEKDLMPGVGNVQYGVVISDCVQFIVSEPYVLKVCFNYD